MVGGPSFLLLLAWVNLPPAGSLLGPFVLCYSRPFPQRPFVPCHYGAPPSVSLLSSPLCSCPPGVTCPLFADVFILCPYLSVALPLPLPHTSVRLSLDDSSCSFPPAAGAPLPHVSLPSPDDPVPATYRPRSSSPRHVPSPSPSWHVSPRRPACFPRCPLAVLDGPLPRHGSASPRLSDLPHPLPSAYNQALPLFIARLSCLISRAL